MAVLTLFATLALLGATQPPVLGAPGDLDPSFGTGGKALTDFGGVDFGQRLAIQPDGRIVVAGTSNAGGTYDFALARYNRDGSLDSSFGIGGKVLTDFGSEDTALDVAIQPDGRIVAAGHSGPNLGAHDFALARYNRDGSLDSSFGIGGKVLTDFLGGDDVAIGVAIQPDGRIVAAGFSGPSFARNFALARYNRDGSLDSSFGTLGKVLTDFGLDDPAIGVAIQPDGRIVASGFSSAGGTFDFALARYLAR